MQSGGEHFASINEVAKQLGVPAHTLRYWEKQFPTVVRPTTGAGGRRYYREQTVERLKTIQDLLYNRGMTIAGVKKMIFNGDFTGGTIGTNTVKHSVPEPRVNLSVATAVPPQPQEQNYERPLGPGALDIAKVDLAIGLLNQASEILKS